VPRGAWSEAKQAENGTVPGSRCRGGLSRFPPAQATIRAVAEALEAEYGRPTQPPPGDPLAGLIATILSQNTTAANSRAAYASLRGRFPAWADCARARPEAVARAIRGGGLGNIKAPRIRAILRQVREREGDFSLDSLHRLPDAEAAAYLCAFDGVGPKTAACVLLFHCGRRVFPVDTHVFRVLGRLGWRPPGATPESAHAFLQPLIPPDLAYSLHVNLVAHGRQVCHARRPDCGGCCLRRRCPSADRIP